MGANPMNGPGFRNPGPNPYEKKVVVEDPK